MKEEEAKTKTCPIFAINPDSGSIYCIGSDCMMWAWDTEYFIEDLGDGIKATGQKQSETDGHCGLAK